MEKIYKVGDLSFERDEDGYGFKTLTVCKASDELGWVSFTPCPDDESEWTTIRNNSYPLNGRFGPKPDGEWVLYEFVGKEDSSANLKLERSPDGFSNKEIIALMILVNLMFAKKITGGIDEAESWITH